MSSLLTHAKALALTLLVCSVAANPFRMPHVPGDDDIGVVELELTGNNRSEPLQPTPGPRDLMISITYPARKAERNARAKEFTPRLATIYARQWNVSDDDVLEIESRAFVAPRYRNTERPIILFSPGYGVSRLAYSALASHLASEGWLTVTVDHTYEPAVVEYPGGRVAYRPANFSNSPNWEQQVELRRRDLSFVLDRLAATDFTQIIPDLNGPLDTSKVGVVGHSLGGATAAAMLVTDNRVGCGANLDGSIFGPALTQTTDKPFLTMDRVDHNRTNDASLATLWSNLKGFRQEVTVEGTTHMSFTDEPIIVDDLEDVDREEVDLGTIKGSRMLDIETAYLNALFDQCFRGVKSDLMVKESKKWRGVKIVE